MFLFAQQTELDSIRKKYKTEVRAHLSTKQKPNVDKFCTLLDNIVFGTPPKIMSMSILVIESRECDSMLHALLLCVFEVYFGCMSLSYGLCSDKCGTECNK